jgi:hypothetical protein
VTNLIAKVTLMMRRNVNQKYRKPKVMIKMLTMKPKVRNLLAVRKVATENLLSIGIYSPNGLCAGIIDTTGRSTIGSAFGSLVRDSCLSLNQIVNLVGEGSESSLESTHLGPAVPDTDTFVSITAPPSVIGIIRRSGWYCCHTDQ